MNKNTKIWLNYAVGGALSLFLLWFIYGQVTRQLKGIDGDTWKHTGWNGYLVLSICLMFLNISLECYKWYLLTRPVEPQRISQIISSCLAGIAFSIITPNRVGDYPGRILYLGRKNAFRYINVSVLGVMSQLSAISLWGLAGLIYYNITFPGNLPKVALAVCIAANIFIAIVYWKFENWLPSFTRFPFLKRFATYGRLLNRMTTARQIRVLSISIIKCSVFTAQYLFLLRWMNVDVPLAEGFLIAALFFWTMASIPSIALTEVGFRGSVGLYLFQHYSANTVGILAATVGVWLLNLILPSIIGSVLLIRMRLLQ
jgi:hypothetical protein